ncbi:MAG: pantoate--beta-alanine ligase [Candidatus Omnitrophica bacterium]|nr:pantoate--beta-alanine ligase [Candidatus Omnitrophota bacterium]
MQIIRNPKKLSEILKKYRSKGKAIGLVPTMGALHEGHLSLLRQARRENNIVVASIFVNPTQFGPGEDFSRYPRPAAKDISCCRKGGVNFIFYPSVKDMYPQGFSTFVTVEGLSSVLCGEHRPGHFRGVATVVAKLFNIVQPDSAYFGQKDAQQAIIIKRMVADLNIPVKVRVMPTIRDKEGLALSSRNVYLSLAQRHDALVLSGALKLARHLFKSGVKDSAKIIGSMKKMIKGKKSAKIDYVAIVDLNNLKPIKKISDNCLITLAVRIGKTRLIDNTIIA